MWSVQQPATRCPVWHALHVTPPSYTYSLRLASVTTITTSNNPDDIYAPATCTCQQAPATDTATALVPPHPASSPPTLSKSSMCLSMQAAAAATHALPAINTSNSAITASCGRLTRGTAWLAAQALRAQEAGSCCVAALLPTTLCGSTPAVPVAPPHAALNTSSFTITSSCMDCRRATSWARCPGWRRRLLPLLLPGRLSLLLRLPSLLLEQDTPCPPALLYLLLPSLLPARAGRTRGSTTAAAPAAAAAAANDAFMLPPVL